MEWTEIVVKIRPADAETACAVAGVAVPYGFYLEDYSDLTEGVAAVTECGIIGEELLSKDRDTALLHLYIGEEENPAEALDFLKVRLADAGIPFEIETRRVDDGDWADGWKKYFKPTDVGERLRICPTWETCADDGRAVLRIDPGAAFGTGTHATTRLCLKALERRIRPGARMLDVGTGSGILAVAALLLGADSVLAADIDPQAVKTARENGAVNGFGEPRLTVKKTDLTQGIDGRFDVVTANLVADIVIRLSADVRRFMKPGAVLIASGILDAYKDEVLTALRAAGFETFETFEEDGWVCIEAV